MTLLNVITQKNCNIFFLNLIKGFSLNDVLNLKSHFKHFKLIFFLILGHEKITNYYLEASKIKLFFLNRKNLKTQVLANNQY